MREADEKAMAELGMHSLLSVSAGSAQPAKLTSQIANPIGLLVTDVSHARDGRGTLGKQGHDNGQAANRQRYHDGVVKDFAGL